LALQVTMEFPLQPVKGTSNPQKGLQQDPSPMNAVTSCTAQHPSCISSTLMHIDGQESLSYM